MFTSPVMASVLMICVVGAFVSTGSNRKSEPKQVMFSDGIRPGGDLTELDGSDQTRIPPRRSGRTQKKVEKQPGLGYSDFLVSGLISNTNL